MAATTTYPPFDNPSVPLATSNTNDLGSSMPASVHKSFDDARCPAADKDAGISLYVTDTDSKSMSRSSSPFLGTDRKVLFASPARSPLAQETNTSIRGQFLKSRRRDRGAGR